MIVWEIALAAVGLYLLIAGRLDILGRQVRARRARLIGLALLAPLALAMLLAVALSVTYRGEAMPDRIARALPLVEIGLVAAALGGALLLFLRGSPPGGLFWHGTVPPSRADRSPPAGAGRMTLAEAARVLHISKLEVLFLLRTGTLTGVRSGWSYHIDRSAVDRLRLLKKE